MLRLTNKNALSISELFTHANIERTAQIDFDINLCDSDLEALSVGLDGSQSVRRLVAATVAEWAKKANQEKQAQSVRRWILPAARRYPRLRYCPICLERKPYYRKSWRLAWNGVCSHHDVLLGNSCGHCSAPVILQKIKWNMPINACWQCGMLLSQSEAKSCDYSEYRHTLAIAFNKLRLTSPINPTKRWFDAVWLLAKWLERIRGDYPDIPLPIPGPLVALNNRFPEAVAFHQARTLWDENPFELKQLIAQYQFEFDRITYHRCPVPLKPYRRPKDWRVPSVEQLRAAVVQLNEMGEKKTYFRIAEVAGCSYETIRKYQHLDEFVKQHVCDESISRLKN